MSSSDLEEVIFNVLCEQQEATGVNIDPLNNLRQKLVKEVGVWLERNKIKTQLNVTESALDEQRYQHSSDNIKFFGPGEGVELPSYGFTILSPSEND